LLTADDLVAQYPGPIRKILPAGFPAHRASKSEQPKNQSRAAASSASR
jgi:hypothetical protein